jgi:hypothetical protein
MSWLPQSKLPVVVKVPNKILTGTTYYSEIQGRLGVDAITLPNADIDARSVLPIAEARIIASVPEYQSLSGDDGDYLYTAAICMVAAVLAPSMSARIAKSKKDYDFQIENGQVDWKSRSIQLVDEAYSFINLISTQTVAELPQMGVAGPTRAKAPIANPTIVDGDTILFND